MKMYSASRTPGGSKYCRSVIYPHLLMLTDMFSEILGQRECLRSGEYSPSIRAQAHSVPLNRKLLLNASLPRNETNPGLWVLLLVRCTSFCSGIVSDIVSTPSPSPPSPTTHTGIPVQPMCLFTFPILTSSRSLGQDCLPFDPSTQMPSRVQLALASIPHRMASSSIQKGKY